MGASKEKKKKGWSGGFMSIINGRKDISNSSSLQQERNGSLFSKVARNN